jgi:hypothetical protein
MTGQTGHAKDEHLRLTNGKAGQFPFAGRSTSRRGLTTRQYDLLMKEWVASIGLDPAQFGAYSMPRTKPVLSYRRTAKLRAVQLLIGESKIESAVRCTGIEFDHAIEINGRIDI